MSERSGIAGSRSLWREEPWQRGTDISWSRARQDSAIERPDRRRRETAGHSGGGPGIRAERGRGGSVAVRRPERGYVNPVPERPGRAYSGATAKSRTGRPYGRGPQTRSQRERSLRKGRARIWSAGRICIFAAELALCIGVIAAVGNMGNLAKGAAGGTPWKDMASGTDGAYLWSDAAAGAGVSGAGDSRSMDAETYPEALRELLELNEEAADYVKGYPDRSSYQNQPIDLTEELQGGGVPLLMQWDRRWGYDAYGDEMIGLSGCGPVCLDMAYLYFTGDAAMTPREMAAFAYDNGYFAGGGTSWSLWTEGAARLGLAGEELPLDEGRMQQVLDEGGLIVCSMRPGDFTTTGHFILLRGYDENGFYVNDPNRRSNSARQWDFETLWPQVKNLWALRQG